MMNMDNYDIRLSQLLTSLSVKLRNIITKMPKPVLYQMEEIRIRKNKPLMIALRNTDYFVSEGGKVSESMKDAYMVTDEDVEVSLQFISQSSLYAYGDDIKNGYITIPGGHRVGITGKVISSMGRVKTIKHISALNYRISKEIKGASDGVLRYIMAPDKRVYHTLIISPPQCGKTTLIRDMARHLSNGSQKLGFRGMKVTIIDERSEICGCFKGIPQNDVGVRTDILDSCPKAEGIIMAIRSMSPSVIITDEIGKVEDMEAIYQALKAGVSIITTVHGSSVEDIKLKPVLSDIMKNKMFERLIVLSAREGPGTIEAIYQGEDYSMIYGGKSHERNS
jgi:stage III sporulation protein AA